MTSRILVALTTVLILGMWFNSTRPISIAAAAILTFMYPPLLALVMVGVGVTLWVRFFRK